MVEIFFCPTWSGYDTRAASLAATIREALGIDVEVTPGGRGQFDVVADGATIFSKQSAGRFPEGDEILARLR